MERMWMYLTVIIAGALLIAWGLRGWHTRLPSLSEEGETRLLYLGLLLSLVSITLLLAYLFA